MNINNNIFQLVLMFSLLITGCIWFYYKIIILYIFYKKRHNQNIYYYNVSKYRESWQREIGSLFPIILAVFLIRFFLYEPFYIPSESMMPTLLIGDFVLVNKFIYGIKNPLNNHYFINNKNPKRGDIVVFQFPKNPKVVYIKRIIGLPGDKIVYNIKNKQVFLYSFNKNNKIIQYKKFKISNYVQMFKSFNKNLDKNIILYNIHNKNIFGGLKLFEYTEKIHDFSHKILFSPEIFQTLEIYHQDNQPDYTWIVPYDSYFVMGDNRDDSYDSRYWGFVNKKYLLGKATYIWMSLEKQKNIWPSKIRFYRIKEIK
ncbi:signal peptidase I [Enterobacteriaceae endosymbiont of Plateumaris braccata]|uniref:signal peptidase I n=1 Tax=Enterobacteriaceae endosymbiont of Plateumaris braccata TaxID=2675793 RepID=UPI001457238D|nr:signal peptidase I [Enterobacteriaceae endosymbiont of Plateumaris braccata]